MTEEKERIWKEVDMASTRCNPGICREGLRKLIKASITKPNYPAEI
jgi:hypothetical protein